jgi:hypothetical protein
MKKGQRVHPTLEPEPDTVVEARLLRAMNPGE